MNTHLFVGQLNQLLASANIPDCLDDVCSLLYTHTLASVTIADASGQIIADFFPPGDTPGEEHIITMPIHNGNISLRRNGDAFDKDETLAIGIAISVCTILLRQRSAQVILDKQRRREVVRNLINTLSYSELEAAVSVIKVLTSGAKEKAEGILVAGSIADMLGVARSVVTAALKKLEGAGLVETRSLGMKGTYIRVKDIMLVEELGKL